MAEKSRKKFWGWSIESRVEQAVALSPDDAVRRAEVFVHSGRTANVPRDWRPYFSETGSAQTATLRVSESADVVRVLVAPFAGSDPETDPQLRASNWALVRDAVGASLGQVERLDVQRVHYGFDLTADQVAAALVGMELALYRFKRLMKSEPPKFKLELSHRGKPVSPRLLKESLAVGQAMNLARHLVNLPPNLLTPESYAEFASQLFSGFKGFKVEVWRGERLKSERMGLMLAVGAGSATPPCLVHIRCRQGKSKKSGPIAFVGKGITFDTGGLDLKPSSGMRLMKKDMGGSAAVLALAYWAALAEVPVAADFYLALAENAVSSTSFRPSDVCVARSGASIEIHNTDAEGRLVLADALDVAVTASEKPKVVVDVATLTGAIKVALGAGLAGLFANDQKLNRDLLEAAAAAGDPVWPMPLVQKYRSTFNTPFADMVNSVDGFGGAITAALFLEKFVRDVPWAHLDIYAWKDSPEGPWLEAGGSGQAVALLAQWLGGGRVSRS